MANEKTMLIEPQDTTIAISTKESINKPDGAFTGHRPLLFIGLIVFALLMTGAVFLYSNKATTVPTSDKTLHAHPLSIPLRAVSKAILSNRKALVSCPEGASLMGQKPKMTHNHLNSNRKSPKRSAIKHRTKRHHKVVPRHPKPVKKRPKPASPWAP